MGTVEQEVLEKLTAEGRARTRAAIAAAEAAAAEAALLERLSQKVC